MPAISLQSQEGFLNGRQVYLVDPHYLDNTWKNMVLAQQMGNEEPGSLHTEPMVSRVGKGFRGIELLPPPCIIRLNIHVCSSASPR